jgi:hypothetical protein
MRWEDNIQMALRDTKCENANYFKMAEGII